MNELLKSEKIQFEIIKSTAPSIGKLLFNNYDAPVHTQNCSCVICENEVRGDRKTIKSTVTKNEYHISPNICCDNSGIYNITCKCDGQYSGKTTVGFNRRYPEHWQLKSSDVLKHLQHSKCTENVSDVKMQFLENVWGRGKYSLSEREYLWNRRLKGVINVQKTRKS